MGHQPPRLYIPVAAEVPLKAASAVVRHGGSRRAKSRHSCASSFLVDRAVDPSGKLGRGWFSAVFISDITEFRLSARTGSNRLIASSDTSISKPFSFDLRGETKMASKIALNIKNLVALGTQRLAELLVELSTTNPAVKRRIRLELAGAQSPERSLERGSQTANDYCAIPIIR
jgi:hypothetical protein